MKIKLIPKKIIPIHGPIQSIQMCHLLTLVSRMRAMKHSVGHKKDCCIIYTTITSRYCYPRNCLSQAHPWPCQLCVCLPKFQILIIKDLVLLTTQNIGQQKMCFHLQSCHCLDNQMIHTFHQMAILKDKTITIRSSVTSAFHV